MTPEQIEIQTVVGPEKLKVSVESRNEGTRWFYRVVEGLGRENNGSKTRRYSQKN